MTLIQIPQSRSEKRLQVAIVSIFLPLRQIPYHQAEVKVSDPFIQYITYLQVLKKCRHLESPSQRLNSSRSLYDRVVVTVYSI